MTNFTNKTFSVHMGANDAYRDNYDRAFGKAAPVAETPLEQAAREATEEKPRKLSGDDLRTALSTLKSCDCARCRVAYLQIKEAVNELIELRGDQ